jgi:hypothetical protein
VGCSFCIVDVRILGNNLDFPVGRSFFSMLAMMVCSLFSVLRSFLLMTTRLALWLSKAFVAESLSLQLQLNISNQPTFSVPPYFHLHILPTRIADWPESDQTTRLRPTPPISMTTSLTHRFLQLAKKKTRSTQAVFPRPHTPRSTYHRCFAKPFRLCQAMGVVERRRCNSNLHNLPKTAAAT